jgi:hypothetical protein
MATTSHIRSVIAVLAALAAGALLLPTTARAYQWPVKPFGVQHPIRGSFGDPRTLFAGPPSQAGLDGACVCSFHEGVDISAPDGTLVYAVEDGTVTAVSTVKAAEFVRVSSGATSFEYWHVVASVAVGKHVVKGVTVLGHVIRGAKHVHLTEIDGERKVNPLQPGHLTPYRDRTTPTVASIAFREPGADADTIANFVRGTIDIVADAHDTPTLAVPGLWHGMPMTPAVVRWRIETWNGRIAVKDTAAYDVRVTIPSPVTFWRVYARGTYQNMSVFGNHFSWLEPGRFLFRLSPNGFDTRKLKDGVYAVVVTATDIAGNSSSASARFTVHNAAGWR